MFDHVHPIDGIFLYRKKFNGSPPFTQGVFLSSKSGVDQAEHANARTVVWLCLHALLLFCARGSKSSARFSVIVRHTCDQAFAEDVADLLRAAIRWNDGSDAK